MRRTLFAFTILFACLFLVPFTTAAESVNVTLYETGRITSYFDQYWVVNVDGNITIDNPTDRDLYEVAIRFDIDSLVIIDVGNTGYLSASSITIPRIPPNTTIRIPYTIVGISLLDPALPTDGVLYTGLTKFTPVIYSDSFGQLQKSNLEDETLTGRPGRLISVELRNPTGFEFTVNSLRVFKTPELDPNQIIDEWNLVNSSDPLTISPDQLFVRDILDRDSAEGQVYWLDVDVFISRVQFIDVSNVTRYTELNLTIPPEFLNYTLNETNATNRSLIDAPILFVRKLSDQQVVLVGKPVTLSLIVNNYAQKILTVSMSDALPPGFTFLGGDGWSLRDSTLSWSGTVSAKNAVVLTYQAELTDTTTAGFDFFESAVARYDSDTAYSNTVPFIRQFVPAQRVYVQKKLRFEGDDVVAVTITVQNLGSSSIDNLILKEYLQDDDAFSQISIAPDEKGLWSIPSIDAGETFEVVYYTTRDSQLNFLPSLFGVPEAEVFRSLVLESVISTAWERVRTKSLEVIGILLLICLPVAYLAFKGKMGGSGGSGVVPTTKTPVVPVPQQK